MTRARFRFASDYRRFRLNATRRRRPSRRDRIHFPGVDPVRIQTRLQLNRQMRYYCFFFLNKILNFIVVIFIDSPGVVFKFCGITKKFAHCNPAVKCENFTKTDRKVPDRDRNAPKNRADFPRFLRFRQMFRDILTTDITVSLFFPPIFNRFQVVVV